jgi:hypothetical protein
MNPVAELIGELAAYGASLAAEPPNDLVLEGDIERVPAELKNRLRAHKAELLAHLATTAELLSSMKRLEAQQISIAVWPTGEFRVVTGEAVGQAWRDGGMVFDPGEMYAYVQLNPEERKLFRELKGLKPPDDGRN